MKQTKFFIFIGICVALFASIPVEAQYYYYPVDFSTIVVKNTPTLDIPAGEYPYMSYSEIHGLSSMGRIIVAVDGMSTLGKTPDDLLAIMEKQPKVTFDYRLGNLSGQETLSGIPCAVPSRQVLTELMAKSFVFIIQNELWDQNVAFSSYPSFKAPHPYSNSVIYERNCQFYKDENYCADNYRLYDYEFSAGGCSAVDKKKFSVLFENYMKEAGYTLDTKNPQMLVQVELFNGTKEQYVPPTQSIDTKYKYGYEWGGGWGSRQYITTTQEGGYTNVTYLKRKAFTALDVAQLKAGAKVPPVIWDMSVNYAKSEPMSMDDFSKLWMPNLTGLINTIYTSNKELDNFNGIGIGVDKNDCNRVVYVIPGSAAEKSGFHIGDRILSYGVYDRKTNKPYRYPKYSLNGTYIIQTPASVMPTIEQLRQIPYLPLEKGKGFAKLHPDFATKIPLIYTDCLYYSQAPLIFKIDRNGTTSEIKVDYFWPVWDTYPWGIIIDVAGLR